MIMRSEKLFWLVVGSASLINLTSWLWMHLKIPKGDYPFILHYNIYFGRDLLVPRMFLFQVPLLGLVILAMNCYLAFVLYQKSRQFSWLVLGATLFLEVFILYASGIIIYVNT